MRKDRPRMEEQAVSRVQVGGTHNTGGREAMILQALRDIMHAVEMAEGNDYSEASKKLLAAAADRASALTWNMPRQTLGGASAAL